MNRFEAVSVALSTNAGTSLRAEDFPTYAPFFVEATETRPLESNANQLIYGRRGSGKTLLLGTLNDRIRAAFPRVRVMSFYYSAADFHSSAVLDGTERSVKQQTHAFFQFFIRSLCQDISHFADAELRRPGWFTHLIQGDAHRRDRLETTILELLEASSYGVEIPTPGVVETSYDSRVADETLGKSSFELGGGLSSSRPRPSVTANASVNRATHHERQASAHRRATPERAFSPGRVKALLTALVDLLGLEHIIIYIDEWMSLAECQIEFADRLDKCLVGDRRLAVKIAADQFQGQFHNSGQGHNFRGLDVGGDIFVAADLDQPFRDLERGATMFAESLYRRLRYFHKADLERHFGPPPLANPDHFISTIFANRHAFEEVCRAAQGLCREFHELTQTCAKAINWDVATNKVDFNTVRTAIYDQTSQAYARAKRSVHANTLLLAVIAPHIQRARSRFFIVPSRDMMTQRIIKDLQTKLVIHDVPGEKLHPSIRGSYDAYEIDYGIFLDQIRAAEFATGDKIDDAYDPDEPTRITSANLPNYLLDVTAVNTEADLLLCPHCSVEFQSGERAFQLKRICPNCFEHQP